MDVGRFGIKENGTSNSRRADCRRVYVPTTETVSWPISETSGRECLIESGRNNLAHVTVPLAENLGTWSGNTRLKLRTVVVP